MSLRLLAVLIALSLSACATHTVKDDAPASDLDAYQANVTRHSTPTRLPNGKSYCLEDAATEDAQDTCAGHLEDALFVANTKVQTLRTMAEKFVARLKLARNPCGFWKRTFKPDECRVD